MPKQLKEVILESNEDVTADRYDKTYPSEEWQEVVSKDVKENGYAAVLRFLCVELNAEEFYPDNKWLRVVELYEDGTHEVISF